MIVVKVELHSANTGEVTEIGRMLVTNISRQGNESRYGDYYVRLMRRGTKDKVSREGYVRNYPRKAYTVWRLIARALKTVCWEEA